MWQGIIAANSEAVRVELTELRDELARLIDVLSDPEAVRDFLEKGRRGVRTLPGKHGSSLEDYVEVVVEIPDAPGALARLFADIDDAGVNVEDVAIEHDPVRQVGFLAVHVTGERADALADLIRMRGWTLKR